MLAPMAVITIGLAPVVGKLVDRVHPRLLAVPGLVLFASRCSSTRGCSRRTSPWGWLLLPAVVLGLAIALHVVAGLLDRHAQPAAAGGGRRLRRLQHDPLRSAA